jgi:hypothetical protein
LYQSRPFFRWSSFMATVMRLDSSAIGTLSTTVLETCLRVTRPWESFSSTSSTTVRGTGHQASGATWLWRPPQSWATSSARRWSNSPVRCTTEPPRIDQATTVQKKMNPTAIRRATFILKPSSRRAGGKPCARVSA